MKVPPVDEAKLVVYEKSGRHHHENLKSKDDLPPATFQLSFLVEPERLGVRLAIEDEPERGSVRVDVAVVYEWEYEVGPDHDLDEFAAQTAIPQVLSCASALLADVAVSVGNKVPFHGFEILEGLVHQFRNRPNRLSEALALTENEPEGPPAE